MAALGLSIPVILFSVFFILQINQPFIEDEVQFAAATVKWVSQGPDWFGLWHTPFYLESLTLWQKLVGVLDTGGPPWILRSFGWVTAFATGLVLFFALKDLQKKKADPTSKGLYEFEPLCLALLFLNPFFIQSSLLVDIDTSLLNPSILLWVVVAEHWDRKKNPGVFSSLFLSLWLGVLLMMKELTPLILIPLWIFWAFLRKWRYPAGKWGRHTMVAILGVALSLLIFWGLLNVWGELRGFHWSDPLRMTQEKFFGRYGPNAGPSLPWIKWGLPRFLFLSYLPILWIGVPALFAGYLFTRKYGFKLSSIVRIPLGIWVAAGIILCYTWLVQAAYYFPKYTAPVLPLLIYSACKTIRIPRKNFNPNLLLAVLLGLFGAFEFFDPLKITENRNLLETMISSRQFIDHIMILSFHAAAVLVPIFILWFLRKKTVSILFALLFYFLGGSIGQAVREHETRYLYGERGFKKAIDLATSIRKRLAPDRRVFVAARDLHWAMAKDSQQVRYEDFIGYTEMFNESAGQTSILLSRTYGVDAVAHSRDWKKWADNFYGCHHFINATNHRFELWWNEENCQNETRN